MLVGIFSTDDVHVVGNEDAPIKSRRVEARSLRMRKMASFQLHEQNVLRPYKGTGKTVRRFMLCLFCLRKLF